MCFDNIDKSALNLKIGILIGEFKDCSNWQLRVIQAILDEPTFEVTVFFVETQKQSLRDNSAHSRFFSKPSLARFVLSLQATIERKVFFKEIYSVDKEGLMKRFKSLPKIEAGSLQQTQTDVLINLGLDKVPIALMQLSKYGIWDFLHTDVSVSQQAPAGFLEVLDKKSSIGFNLVKWTSETQVEILDRAFFNRGWSMVETATTAQEGGVSVLLKNLKRLQKGFRFEKNSLSISNDKQPGLVQVLKYIVQFNMHVLSKIKQKLAYKFLGQRHECWSVFIGKGSFLESTLSKSKPLEMPKDEFWADPFLFKHQATDYVFFENYSYKSNRGKISCGKVNDQELTDIVDVLDLEYHLSFPFIFEQDGAIYLMPETSENKRLEIYKAVDFPTKWELFTTAFEGELVADAFFYDDEQNQKWLFVNKQAAKTSPMNSELFIYKTDSLKLDNLQAHAQNPVIIDARVARNGGAIFKHMDEIYRPSQRNTDGIYGRALNINKIKKLTIDEYEEENTRICEPNFDKNLMATHHLHQTDELFVFDAAYSGK